MSRKIAIALAIYVGLLGPAWGQNHSLESDHVAINTQAHWRNWEFVEGTLDVAANGEVVPAFVAKGNNAVLDILDHLRRTAEGVGRYLLTAIWDKCWATSPNGPWRLKVTRISSDCVVVRSFPPPL